VSSGEQVWTVRPFVPNISRNSIAFASP
jgi:hypothetical protein